MTTPNASALPDQTVMDKRDWSAEFNALPIEIRTIGAALEIRTRIQHLNFEKNRLKSRYEQSVAEINDHIKNCEQGLSRLERENPPSTQAQPVQPAQALNDFEEKCARNSRVQNRYDELMRIGKHGHYETMFRVVLEEVERALLTKRSQ